METRRSSFAYEDLLSCGRGELFVDGPQLPLPPMLMFDRISEVKEEGGEHGWGRIVAELDVADDASVRDGLASVLADAGRVDVMVNNAGIAVAGVVMGVLSLFDLGTNTPLFMLLRNGHFSFKVPVLRAVQNVAIIAVLTLAAAYLPARSAARLLPAQALRTTK